MTAPLLISFLVLQWPRYGTLSDALVRPQHACQTYHFKRLFCLNLNLSTIPTELNPSLTHLDLSSNIIQELEAMSLTSLQHLDVSHNKVQFIHEEVFRDLVDLRTLSLANNSLSNNVTSNSRAFQSLHRLKALDVSLNGLTERHVELYLSNMSSLELLDLSANILTTLRPELFTKSRKLRSINMENNLISEIQKGTFESLKRLSELKLAKNNLATICDFKLHQLKLLNLSRNSLEIFLTHESENIYQLEVLDLSYNNLLFFPMVPKRNNLRYLSLQNNHIGVLENKMEVVQEHFPYSELTNLEATANNIYANLQKTPLVDLDLSDNQFNTFPLRMFSYLPSLKSLNLSNNCLTNINDNESENILEGQSQQFFTSLRSLDLQNNNIKYLSPTVFRALPNLEKLVLKKNNVKPCSSRELLDIYEHENINVTENIPCISFRRLEALKHLNLQENGIKELSPHTFQQTPLVSLNLDDNDLTVVAKGALDGLQNTLESLSISGSKLTQLDLSIKCLRKLRILNVAGNSMDALPDIVACSPLRELDLRNNNFTYLAESAVKNVSLHLNTIYISGNPFNCCSAGWLNLLSAANVNVVDLKEAVCFTKSNGSLFPELISTQSKKCHLQDTTKYTLDLINLILLSLFCFMFIVVLLFVLKRYLLIHGSSFTFRNNKVASFQFQKDNQCSTGVAKVSIS